MLLICQQHKVEASIQTGLALVALLEEPARNVLDITHSLYRFKLGRHPKQALLQKRAQALADKLACNFSLQQLDESVVGVCLALAFPDRVGQNRADHSGRFILANGHGAFIDNQEPLSESPYIVAVDLMRTTKDASHIFVAAGLDIQRLQTQQSQLFSERSSVYWDERKGGLVAEQQCRFDQLIITRRALGQPEQGQVTQALIDHIRRKGLQILPWGKGASALLERLRCGADWFAEKNWPALSDDALLADLEQWLAPYMTQTKRVNQLVNLDLEAALRAYIGWPLNQEIDTLLPTHYRFATGTNKRIQYQLGSPPMLSIKLQEVFGEQTSPTIADNRQKVVLELLSPAQRPLQITADLAAFWQGAYKEVQKEMKGRYPKHPWPDDPAQHIATRKTKRQLNL
jgi:ATP-dependent helicase HrpB